MTREDLINQRATTCRHGGHCEWVACDKCNHYEPKPETITNSTSGYLEVVLPECSDCISRQAVLEVLKKNRYRFNISQEGYCEGKVLWSENLIKDDACKEIEQLPSVTPKEKIGRWREDANKIDAQFGRHTYICSECGKYAEYFISGTEVWWDRIKPNYCPNCGCRMRGDSNGNE